MKKESKNFKSLFCESCTPSQVHKGCDNKGVLLTPRKYQAALYCTDSIFLRILVPQIPAP